jgi:leader peptidase (prepilin peptidase) / N-methyltransferase
MSETTSALIAGFLGIVTGGTARFLVIRHHQRSAPAPAEESAPLAAEESAPVATETAGAGAGAERTGAVGARTGPPGPGGAAMGVAATPRPLWRVVRRPPLLEVAMAAVWALLALRVWPAHPAALPAYLVLGFACVTLAVIDLDTRLLPDRITIPAFALVAVLLLVASLVEHDLGRMLRGLEAALAGSAGLLVLVLISPGGMGRGDVKFALVLGLALGWLGWDALLAGFAAAFLIGGVAALVAVLVLRMGRKAHIPFGPWLAAGTLLAILAATTPPPPS